MASYETKDMKEKIWNNWRGEHLTVLDSGGSQWSLAVTAIKQP